MAHIELYDNPIMPVYYNVTMAVGQWCANRCDDVLLVQYMLHSIYRKPYPNATIPPRPLKVDGVCGRVTVEYIYSFQSDMSRISGYPIKVDGRVDPARGKFSDITHTIYTILFINRVLKDYSYSGDFNNFPDDPSVPAIVRGSLGGSAYATGVID